MRHFRAPRRLVPLLTVVAVLAACGSGQTPLDPDSLEARSVPGLPGVEHILTIASEATEGGASFVIHSTIRNTGNEPATLEVRTCYLGEEDVRGGHGGLTLYEPLMVCAAHAQSITLAPGEASETLTLSGVGPSGSTHHVEIRHTVDPEHWSPVTLALP